MIAKVVLLAVALCFSLAALSRPGCYDVIPMPRSVELDADAAPFGISSDTRILFKGGEDMERNAYFLADYIKRYAGVSVQVAPYSPMKDSGKNILLTCDPFSSIPKEGYRTEISAEGITVVGSSSAGVFYGVQLLRKALPGAMSSGKILLEPAVVEDYPHFAYRGAHFDVCRHFFTVDEVKEYIDMMSLHNMNVLHWHLTDDQGWRVEIKRYPELTGKGSMRDETLIGHLNDRPERYDGRSYGGFYTQDEIREIVRYAADRYIDIVPEIDLPGHMQAALSAYPELGCTGGPYKVWTKWGVSEDVLCAGNDAVLEFLDGVFTEITEMFPGEYVHIGGDECPKTRWENCPKCQKKAIELGLHDDMYSTKEQKLQSYVMKHVASFLKACGKKVIGWDEILEGDAAEGAVVMSWRGEKGGIEAARLGHDVVMTPNSYLYFDFYQGKNVAKEPLAIGGYIPVKKVYEYDPVPESLNAEEAGHILGLQANLWTEYIASFSHVQYMVLPRWAALAENQWSYPLHKNYKEFLDRLEDLITVYGLEGYAYAKHVLEIVPTISPDFEKGCITVGYETMGDVPIHYTLDGSMPSVLSPVVDGVLEIGDNAVLSAFAFRDGVSGPVAVDTISFNKATARPVSLGYPSCERYTFSGAQMLVDGLKGDVIFGSGRWIGFETTLLDAVVDLREQVEFSSITLGVCVNTADGVFDARRITVSVSDDGVEYRTVAELELPQIMLETKGVRRHSMAFQKVAARYVRVVAEPESVIPRWSWLKGARAFLFCDEIEIL